MGDVGLKRQIQLSIRATPDPAHSDELPVCSGKNIQVSSAFEILSDGLGDCFKSCSTKALAAVANVAAAVLVSGIRDGHRAVAICSGVRRMAGVVVQRYVRPESSGDGERS